MSETKPLADAKIDSKQTFSDEGVSGFVDWLILKKVVTEKMVKHAVTIKRANNVNETRALFQILIEECEADRDEVYKAFSKYYSFKVFDSESLQLTPDKLHFISKLLNALPSNLNDLAKKNMVVPYQAADGDSAKLLLLTPDPTNTIIPIIARGFPYPKYEVCYIALKTYEEIGRQLTIEKKGDSSSEKVEYIEDDKDADEALAELDDEILKGHLGEMIDNILADAVQMNASDIHIVPKGARKTEFRLRVDGHLTLWRTVEDVRADAISAVVKDIGKGTDRFERSMAQDGFAQKTINNKLVRFRLSIIPIVGRDYKVKLESIVIRVLIDPETNVSIENLGFQPWALERFKKAIGKPSGLVILTGPTGSGKSTTLLTALRSVMDPSLNVITVEDPVEYLIEEARQVKLSPKLDFENAMRAILRHDPDIVMVGEMRDRITADMAIKLANTGHLTFSTLHTNDAVGVIARLYKMGIEPFLLAYAINIIVAQRLIRKLCDRCKIANTEIIPISLEKIGFSKEEIEKTTFYRSVGCLRCVGGFKGRAAIHEVLYFTKELRQLIMEAGSSINEESIRNTAVKQGMKTLRESGLELVKAGRTTPEEIASMTTDEQ